jgi:hypothetical protein
VRWPEAACPPEDRGGSFLQTLCGSRSSCPEDQVDRRVARGKVLAISTPAGACRRWGWLNSKRNCSTKASAGEALNHQSPFSAAVQTQTISVEQRYFVLSGSISIMPCWISRARRPEAGLHLRRARPCGADVRLSVGGYPDNARAKGEFHSPLDPPTNRARAFRVLSVARQTD